MLGVLESKGGARAGYYKLVKHKYTISYRVRLSGSWAGGACMLSSPNC